MPSCVLSGVAVAALAASERECLQDASNAADWRDYAKAVAAGDKTQVQCACAFLTSLHVCGFQAHPALPEDVRVSRLRPDDACITRECLCVRSG